LLWENHEILTFLYVLFLFYAYLIDLVDSQKYHKVDIVEELSKIVNIVTLNYVMKLLMECFQRALNKVIVFQVDKSSLVEIE
jgi:hypothetical protein